jgi:hypothetical protein
MVAVMKSNGERSTIKDLEEEPAPQVDAGFFRQPAYREVGFMGSGVCT